MDKIRKWLESMSKACTKGVNMDFMVLIVLITVNSVLINLRINEVVEEVAKLRQQVNTVTVTTVE